MEALIANHQSQDRDYIAAIFNVPDIGNYYWSTGENKYDPNNKKMPLMVDLYINCHIARKTKSTQILSLSTLNYQKKCVRSF